MDMCFNKVFGIGLNKTGTTTLGECGRILGLRVKGCKRKLLEDIVLRNDYSRVKGIVDAYDLLEDWPWPLIFKELDGMYPGSKFILTVRKSDEAWITSLKKHALQANPAKNCRKLAYGYSYPQSNEEEHKAIYNNHNAAVREYFRNRKNDFIELCWENGDGWEELCRFLHLSVPVVDFPHANNAAVKRKPIKTMMINRLNIWLRQLR